MKKCINCESKCPAYSKLSDYDRGRLDGIQFMVNHLKMNEVQWHGDQKYMKGFNRACEIFNHKLEEISVSPIGYGNSKN